MLTANSFHDLMGKSPLPLLQQHLGLAMESTEQAPMLLSAALKSDRGDLKALRFSVLDIAHQADMVHAELARDWPKGVLTPISRRDMVFVLESQKQILDASREIAGLLQLPLDIPLQINRLMLSLAECGAKTCGRALRVTQSLDAAIRSGLKGPDASAVYELVDEVRQSNNSARALADDLRVSLHEQCKDSDAVSLAFMLELTRLLAELPRLAEISSGRALLLVSR